MLNLVRGNIKILTENGEYVNTENPLPVIGTVTLAAPVAVSGTITVDELKEINDPKIYNVLEMILIELTKIRLHLETITDEQITSRDTDWRE